MYVSNFLNKVAEKKKIYIKTYGCQMNVYDSERMLDLMYPHSYSEEKDYREADLIILNTCQQYFQQYLLLFSLHYIKWVLEHLQ